MRALPDELLTVTSEVHGHSSKYHAAFWEHSDKELTLELGLAGLLEKGDRVTARPAPIMPALKRA